MRKSKKRRNRAKGERITDTDYIQLDVIDAENADDIELNADEYVFDIELIPDGDGLQIKLTEDGDE